jgi:serine/threonine protein kinase
MEGTLSFDARFGELVQVGSGSMGTVYKAWDQVTGTHVALKLLHNTSTTARFQREGRVLSQITHLNIVRHVAHGMTPTGQPWLAMEWLDGTDLDAYLKAGVLEYAETLRLARALSSGLSWAHDRGFIHRDMKPSNVLIPPSGVDYAKILDFGLARDVVQEDALTKTGMLIGTLEYMPPEQVSDAKRADQRADVFSLGAVLYHCLTGVPPARGNSLPEILMNIVRGNVPPVSNFRQDVPQPFMALLTSMLEKNADKRPANATHVALALDAIERRANPVLDLDGATEMMSERPSFVPRSTRPMALPPMPRLVPPPPAATGPTPSRPALSSFSAPDPVTLAMPPKGAPQMFPPRPAPIAPKPPPAARRFQWWPLGLLALGVLAIVLALYR